MERRDFLKTTGIAVGVAAVGGSALTGGAAASNMTVSASNQSLTNDDGEVRQVTIDPKLTVSWSDLDDPVGAVSIFVEGKVVGDNSGPNGGYYPLMRAEPVVLPDAGPNQSASQVSTTGHYNMQRPVSKLGSNRTLQESWASGASQDGDIIVADDEHGAPDYSGASEGYLQGANVYGATIPNSPDIINGEYGAAADADAFDASQDGGKNDTRVRVRYTVQLLQLGLNHFKNITGYDVVSDTDGTIGGVRSRLEELYDHSAEEWSGEALNNTDHISDVAPEEITVVAVTDAGDYTTDPSEPITWEAGPTSRHAADARQFKSNHGSYPGVLVSETQFRIRASNEQSGSSGSGSSNTGVQ
jgi:hypothetical protein